MSAGQARVRLRWARGSYITVPMPTAEAGELQDELLADVLAKGDGAGFVDFTGHDGREVSVRARDVVSVECLPDLPDRVRPGLRVADAYTSIQGEGGESPGTAFLRRIVAEEIHAQSGTRR